MGVPTVLLVDDEPSVRRVLRKLFEKGGMGVVEAASGPEALRTLDSGTPIDAVVSDVVMPELSGVAFYDSMVARLPHLAERVVFLTGAAQDPGVSTIVEQRSVPLISKLDDLQLVVDAVRVALVRLPPSTWPPPGP